MATRTRDLKYLFALLRATWAIYANPDVVERTRAAAFKNWCNVVEEILEHEEYRATIKV